MLFVQGPPLFRCANIAYNQALQALVNYGNGNTRSPERTREIMSSFGGAITMSASIVLGARLLLSKHFHNLKGSKLIMANTLLNIVAVGTANATNVVMMRQNEIKEGIPVTNK